MSSCQANHNRLPWDLSSTWWILTIHWHRISASRTMDFGSLSANHLLSALWISSARLEMEENPGMQYIKY